MRYLRMMLDLAWLASSFVLLTVWVTTVTLGPAGILAIVAFATLMPLLFAVEGLELAVTALLHRPADVHGGALAELTRIRNDAKFSFFPHRQLFVVVSIVTLTLVNTFDAVYVPGVGRVADGAVLFAFNLAFSTLSVLLLAQIPSKRLALVDPARFFRATWLVCIAVRWVGETRLTEPAETLVRLLMKLLRYPTEARRLREPLTVQYDSIDDCWLIVVPER